MIPIITLLVALTLSLLITRIATVALTLTGISMEAARFQARSALTGVGFTTSETEQIVGHPVRRRIVMLLMLLGNIGLVTVVTSLMLSFLGQSESTGLLGMSLLLGGLVLLWIAAASRWLDRRMCTVIEWALRKWTDIDARDYASLLHLSEGFGVAEVAIERGHWIEGKSLGELNLKGKGILVLGVHRKSGSYDGTPREDARVEAGDIVLVYGREPNVAAVCSRSGT